MELEISKLLSRGQFNGDFEFAYNPTEDLCMVPLCKIEGDITVRGSFQIYDDDSVEVKLNLTYLISGQCSYCLNDASKKIVFDTEVLFVPEKNEDDYFYDGRKVDLKTAVNEAILMSQPSVILCKEDCDGIVVK